MIRQNNQKTFYAAGKPLIFNKKKQKIERNVAYKKFNRRLAGKKICFYRMKKWTIFDIDNKRDFEIVEWLLSSKKADQRKYFFNLENFKLLLN